MAAQPHDHDAPDGLLSVEEARERVLGAIHPLAPLRLPLTDAFGCVVAEDVVATHDLPEFASSAMDGFAVRASDVAAATPSQPVELKIVPAVRSARRAVSLGLVQDRRETFPLRGGLSGRTHGEVLRVQEVQPFPRSGIEVPPRRLILR